ncbi:hypothetical protein GCM10027185_21090 [Spirosoma pulveris]
MQLSFAQQTQKATDYFNDGLQKSAAKDYPVALHAFTMSILQNPENGPSYYNRALTKLA